MRIVLGRDAAIDLPDGDDPFEVMREALHSMVRFEVSRDERENLDQIASKGKNMLVPTSDARWPVFETSFNDVPIVVIE